jgi:polyhydroxybutyrate depolymerase
MGTFGVCDVAFIERNLSRPRNPRGVECTTSRDIRICFSRGHGNGTQTSRNPTILMRFPRTEHAALVAAIAFGLGCGSSGNAGTGATDDSGTMGQPGSGSSSGGSSGGNASGNSDSSSGQVAISGAPGSGSGSGQGQQGDGQTTPTTDASGTSAAGGTTVVACPSTVLRPGDSNESLQIGGTMRSYILHVPPGYTGKTPIPLVVDYHPILSTDTFEKGNSGYAALGDTEGFAIVFPQGIDNAWNVGPCCTTSRTVDDVGFSRALVQAVEAKVCVDPKRVYAVGYSMGGGMAHYLGCNAADVFASIAPAAFDLLVASEEPCNPSRPITEISFRGTADPIVPYGGGASMPPNGLNVTIHFLGAQGTLQRWSQLDGCTGSPTMPDSNGCSTYSNCKDGVEATLCTKQGGGHDTGDARIGWAMLKAHPMP